MVEAELRPLAKSRWLVAATAALSALGLVAGDAAPARFGTDALANADRAVFTSVCPQDPEPAPYIDRNGAAPVHLPQVDCAYEAGLMIGRDGERGLVFQPRRDVLRDQTASAMFRMMDATGASPGPASTVPAFEDTRGSVHAEAIAVLAEHDVIRGYRDASFRPREPVRRDQMARFLVGAAGVEVDEDAGEGSRHFADVGAGNIHAAAIDLAYELGFLEGVEAPVGERRGRFEPRRPTSRQQLATMLVRSWAQVEATSVALTNDTQNEALFALADVNRLAPGGAVSATVQVTNAGESPMAARLRLDGLEGSHALAEHLELRVLVDGRDLERASLTELAARDAGEGRPVGLEPGVGARYLLVVRLSESAPERLQGEVVSGDLTWHGRPTERE